VGGILAFFVTIILYQHSDFTISHDKTWRARELKVKATDMLQGASSLLAGASDPMFHMFYMPVCMCNCNDCWSLCDLAGASVLATSQRCRCKSDFPGDWWNIKTWRDHERLGLCQVLCVPAVLGLFRLSMCIVAGMCSAGCNCYIMAMLRSGCGRGPGLDVSFFMDCGTCTWKEDPDG
jgi:hypothetical protein